MMSHVKTLIPIVVGVLIALIVYNKFIVGHFGMFEGSNNYDVDDNGNVMKVAA